jgi:ectoine hydroxylase-related dioxygenase (phytanoyl-CoA dioxygenase family)
MSSLPRTNCRTKTDWLERTVDAVRESGIMVVEGLLADSELKEARERLYGVQQAMIDSYGRERMVAAKEVGILRIMMKHDPYFIRFLELPQILSVVDATVSPTAILHVQTGILLPPVAAGSSPDTFQFKLHRDFPRYLNGFLGCIDVFLAIDEFSEQTGGTRVAPRSHQKEKIPTEDELEKQTVTVDAPAGSMIVFDSTLWHGSGINRSGKDRLAINHLFTRSFFKQQFDYSRLLGESFVESLKPRTQQLLGYYTRVPSSFDEYYRPADKRLYRSGQG